MTASCGHHLVLAANIRHHSRSAVRLYDYAGAAISRVAITGFAVDTGKLVTSLSTSRTDGLFPAEALDRVGVRDNAKRAPAACVRFSHISHAIG